MVVGDALLKLEILLKWTIKLVKPVLITCFYLFYLLCQGDINGRFLLQYKQRFVDFRAPQLTLRLKSGHMPETDHLEKTLPPLPQPATNFMGEHRASNFLHRFTGTVKLNVLNTTIIGFLKFKLNSLHVS